VEAEMALQAERLGAPETAFTAADCDGLSLASVIRKFVFDPLAQELGDAVGALRSDGWIWIQVDSQEDQHSENKELLSTNIYCIHTDGTIVANPVDLAEIERDGIHGCRCKRLSGTALDKKRKNWIRFLFEHEGSTELDVLTANFVGVEASDFIWPVQLEIEDILPALHSLAQLSERPLDRATLDAIRSVATRITKRWHDLMEFLRRGELVVMGSRIDHRERISSELWSDQKVCIDVPSGRFGKSKSDLIAFIDGLFDLSIPFYGARINRSRNLDIVWRDLQLWSSERDLSSVTTMSMDGNSRLTRVPSPHSVTLPRRPRGPDAIKTRAAAEKLRTMLRKGDITPAELTNPIGEGGRKQQEIADLLGVQSRTTAKSIVKLVLSEIEFVPLEGADKYRH
jgi:hypothetical protein